MVMREGLVKVLLPCLADSRDQLRVALGVAVMGVTGLRVAEGRVDDSLVGREVRIADAQVDNVLVLGQRFGVERQARAGALEALGDIISLHGSSSFIHAPRGNSVSFPARIILRMILQYTANGVRFQ